VIKKGTIGFFVGKEKVTRGTGSSHGTYYELGGCYYDAIPEYDGGLRPRVLGTPGFSPFIGEFSASGVCGGFLNSFPGRDE
jgi:hypothetical protein